MLSYGSKGENVRKLQTALNRAGSNLTVDGEFGAKTKQAVYNFQGDNGLRVDGIVGDETWAALQPYLADFSAIKDTLEKCLTAIEQLPEFRQLERMLYG